MGSSHHDDRFFVRNGDIIVATGAPDRKLFNRIESASRPQLVLNTALGFDASNLNFLESVGRQLVSLEVVGSFESDGGLAACVNLEELNLNTDLDETVDWSNFPKLRYLFSYDRRLNSSVRELRNLYYAHIYGATEANIALFSGLPELRELIMSSSRATQMPEGDWNSLTTFGVRRGQKFDRFESIGEMLNLQSLTLTQCPRLENIDFAGGLSEMTTLDISENREIASLAPLSRCRLLEVLYFYGSTKIIDGDLGVLGRLPNLTRAHYRRRRHYHGAPPNFPTVDE